LNKFTKLLGEKAEEMSRAIPDLINPPPRTAKATAKVAGAKPMQRSPLPGTEVR
jgi:hypothetical protein